MGAESVLLLNIISDQQLDAADQQSNVVDLTEFVGCTPALFLHFD